MSSRSSFLFFGPALLMVWATVFEVAADIDSAVVRLESIELIEHPDGIELEMVASGDLDWRLRDPGNHELVVRLLRCRPGAQLAELRSGEGLVESVVAQLRSVSEQPETWISIRTRQPVKYRVTTGEHRLTTLLLPRDPPTDEAADAAPETMPVPDVPKAESTPESGEESGGSMPPAPQGDGVTTRAAEAVESSETPSPVTDSESVASLDESVVSEPDVSSAFTARNDEYRVGFGDVLAIDVFGLDELNRKVRVQPNGKISLPLIGRVFVAGLSIDAAERRIGRRLSERQLVRDPQVSIFVEELVSRAVNVQGAVVKPGIYQLIGGKTLLELIGEAGGVREDHGGKILILRTEAGEEHRLELDLERLTAGADRSLNPQLLPGDVVMVPFSRQLRVYVSGAVEKPGPVLYSSSDGISVLQAIIAAGGPTSRANVKNVHILRRQNDGQQHKIEVNLKKIQSGKMDDQLLERNDTVVVGEWFF